MTGRRLEVLADLQPKTVVLELELGEFVLADEVQNGSNLRLNPWKQWQRRN